MDIETLKDKKRKELKDILRGAYSYSMLDEFVNELVNELSQLQGKSMPKIAEVNKVALTIAESVTPKLTENEQAFFIAGFIECAKLNSIFSA